VHGLARYGIAWQELSHVVISHWHNDHVGDLPALLFALRHGLPAPRTRPLTVVGPIGMASLLERMAAAFGDHVLDPGFELRVVETAEGRRYEDRDAGFTLVPHPAAHTPESLAYRVEGDWGTVGYTGDSGPSAALAEFLSGCDVLVAECTLPDDMATGTHLSPSSLAALASVASPALLVIVHVTPLHTPAQAESGVRTAYGGPIVAAADGLRVRLRRGGPSVTPSVDPARALP
jgi:ribonuclease BN (tRNA processing enzyme)